MAEETSVMFRSGAGIKTDIEGKLFLSVDGFAESDISQDAEDKLIEFLMRRRDARSSEAQGIIDQFGRAAESANALADAAKHCL
jgi:hypothetical protein